MSKHVHGGDVYRFRDYLDYSSNCNPLGLPGAVKEAIIEAIDASVHYPDVQCEELKAAIAAYEQTEEAYVVCGNGAAEVIFSLCLAGKPKTALLPAPTFAEYEQALESVDCRLSYYHLDRSSGFVLDEGILERIAQEKPDIFFVCNPNNPTGVLTEKRLLEELLQVCEEVGCLLVIDECFLDFIEEPQAYTMKEYLSKKQNLFLVKAFTKRYAMAGVRLGYGLTGNRSLLEKMQEVTQPWNVSGLAQAAGVAALKQTAYVEEGRQLIFRERAFLKEELHNLGLRIFDSAANYLFFEGPKELAQKMKQHQILIRDCSNYVGLRQGDFRIAVRSHEENCRLVEALKIECK